MKNLLVVDLGLIGAFPVVLIASMTGNSNEHNRNEILSITPVQATWLGKSDHILPSDGEMCAAAKETMFSLTLELTNISRFKCLETLPIFGSARSINIKFDLRARFHVQNEKKSIN